MKTSHDPRHLHRISQVKLLYTYSFAGVVTSEIEAVVAKIPELDEKIKLVATEWSIADMNKIDLAILRLGVFELLQKENKPAIIIDEAIEIAKEFGADHSSKFVNAVLSKIAGSL